MARKETLEDSQALVPIGAAEERLRVIVIRRWCSSGHGSSVLLVPFSILRGRNEV
jgi:hypothetical protein